MFLLVLAYPGSPGQKAVKRLCVCVLHSYLLTDAARGVYGVGAHFDAFAPGHGKPYLHRCEDQ